MGKMLERKCRYCGNVYKYEGAVNFIAFCPYCKRYDFSEPENGCGSNTPCRIYIGDKTMVDIHDRLEKIRDMIDKENYFVINRGRQYGKTTTPECT